MTTTLFDARLERLLVVALLNDPSRHDTLTVDLTDLADMQAHAVFTAFANIRARGEHPSAALIRAELADNPSATSGYHGDPHRGWLDEMMAMPLPEDPPIDEWEQSLLEMSELRMAEIAAAEPSPRRKANGTYKRWSAEMGVELPSRHTGPKAANIEPVRLAEAFRRYHYETDEEPTLVRWARAWWRYDGTRYVELDDELLDREIIGFLDICVAPQEVRDKVTGVVTKQLRRVTHKRKTLGEVSKAMTFAMPSISGGSPQWTAPVAGDPPADRLVACANGLLDVDKRQIYPATPRFFATTALGAAWDPNAPEPTAWLAFLASIWGEDKESIRALQQVFGYLLTTDTSQQKLFALIGPPRSGKGTIARVLRALLSPGAVVHPTLKSLEDQFGMAPLVGKTLAIIGDARLGGKSDQAQVVERLLSISGEDGLSVDRKNRDAIDVRLRCRVLLLSNELPRLYDTSGALASRFVILCLSRSFLGNEDTTLEAKLLAELPGILRWALDGRDDLAESGKFVQPLASTEAQEHLASISNPLGVFLRECCELRADARITTDDLYSRYKNWCEANGREPSNKQVLGRDLHTIHPELIKAQWRTPAGKQVYGYRGLQCV